MYKKDSIKSNDDFLFSNVCISGGYISEINRNDFMIKSAVMQMQHFTMKI